MAGRERHAQAVRPAGGWTAEGAANIYNVLGRVKLKEKKKGVVSPLLFIFYDSAAF